LSKLFTSPIFSAIIEEETGDVAHIFKYNERSKKMFDLEGIEAGEFLSYKGKPLVRQEDEIIYGDLSEKNYVYMMIMSDKKSTKCDTSIPAMIMVQLLDSATKAIIKQKVVPGGLSEALEFAEAWLR
jgi:hypothetical protein